MACSPYINELLSLNSCKKYFHSYNTSFVFLSLSSIIVSLSILSSFTVDKVWASTAEPKDISTYMITTRDFQAYPKGVNDSGFNNNYHLRRDFVEYLINMFQSINHGRILNMY